MCTYLMHKSYAKKIISTYTDAQISYFFITTIIQVIREMEGTIQLKKYRTMRRRYGEGVDEAGETSRIGNSVNDMLK